MIDIGNLANYYGIILRFKKIWTRDMKVSVLRLKPIDCYFLSSWIWMYNTAAQNDHYDGE